MRVQLCERDEAGGSLPFLVVRLDAGTVALSSAPVGGGFGPRAWIINAQVPMGYDRTDLAAHIDEMRIAGGLPDRLGVGMLTGAHVGAATTAERDGVRVVSTVGVSEPEWAAAPRSHSIGSGATAAGTIDHPGTINTVAWLPVALAPGAMVNAVITVTEAKTQALLEAGLAGTGTATDAVCIVTPGAGTTEPFAGPRSRWGHRLAIAAHETVRDGIESARAASP
jgi:adenosylcobinamide amidohydrolase